MKQIIVSDMTKLFKKEILLYSLFDMHFKSPVRLMTGVYFSFLFVIWSLPIMFLFWPGNRFTYGIALIPPIILAPYMSKPIWGGKSFFSWAKTQILFISKPRLYYDLKGSKPLKNEKIDNVYTVSRAKDFHKLLVLEREEHKMKKMRGKT